MSRDPSFFIPNHSCFVVSCCVVCVSVKKWNNSDRKGDGANVQICGKWFENASIRSIGWIKKLDGFLAVRRQPYKS